MNTTEQKIQFPLQFEIVEIPDEGTDVEGELPFSAVAIEDTERWTFSTPFRYSLHFSAINAGKDLLVQGSVSGSVQVLCDRCEDEFSWDFSEKNLCYTFENAFGTTIDLTDFIREDILLSFPQQFLCSEDCQGLCPQCGQNLNHGECDCESPEESEGDNDRPNPWAALDKLSASEK